MDLRKAFTLKDGLHQFKKNVQMSENGLPHVENVARKLIELAEQKLESAQAKADERDSIEDDFDAESPEDTLLSAVSNEQSKDRADREVVAPWLRFLWEAYRLVLELLRNNARLEVTYSSIVRRAYNFCLKYSRKNEFKRLSDTLRTHIQTAAQKGGVKQVNAIDLRDPETVQRYMDLRFNQLNVSVGLELWQEAYRSIEDIHGLIDSSRHPMKPHTMMSYYKNLAKIFFVSDNGLFHAAAWNSYYNLYSQSPLATEKELSHYATLFMLSSLAIPQESYNADSTDVLYSNQRLASLLKLQKVPTRDTLISAALNKTVYDYVDPTVKKLYQLLEADFHPLSIREELNKIIVVIEASPELSSYVKPLTKVILTRLFQQVSQVYQSVKLDFLINLATFEGKFKLSELEIESFLLNAGRDGYLSFYIDHDADVITFRSDPFEEIADQRSALQTSPAELIQTQLSTLAKTLYASAEFVDPTYTEKQTALRERLIESATSALKKEREELEKSRQLLEEREEQAEAEKKIREQEAARARIQKLEEEKANETKRIEEEAKRRMEERIKRETDAVENDNKKKLIEKIKSQGTIKLEVTNLDDISIEELHKMQVIQLEKDKHTLETYVKSLFKKLDHTERAYRRAELPQLEKDAATQKDRDLKIYEEVRAKKVAIAKKEHDEAVALRDRLQKIVPDYSSYRDKIDAEAVAKREIQIKKQADKLEAAKKARIEQVRQERYARAVAEYEEAKKRELEEAERIKQEALKAELEQKRINDFKRLDGIAEKQRQAEEEALARQTGRSSGGYRPPAARTGYVPPAAREAPRDLPPRGLPPRDLPPREFPRDIPVREAPRQEAPAAVPAPGAKLTYAEKLRLKREGRI